MSINPLILKKFAVVTVTILNRLFSLSSTLFISIILNNESILV
ncbi:299R [Invertebrate iridescent virus Kaz2018]|uniref:299R n=1 Tax=Invertebrate iridescent virus 6 TaxID=176652 RepID=Q91FM5_IIV6|nr:299R [Invertebrate iridescent virus 6]AAK82160.1 299R [Invertebrate iridescent virus 6]QMS79598.1 hypothetical protein IIV6-T1_293 [Invertebrate iridescent virus 6]QNH08709.1 299R [Invertebrate iridescent virus Kaz2018]